MNDLPVTASAVLALIEENERRFAARLAQLWPHTTDPSAWYVKSTALVRMEECPIYVAYTGIWHYSDMNPHAMDWMVSHCDWILVLPYSYDTLTARYHGYRTR